MIAIGRGRLDASDPTQWTCKLAVHGTGTDRRFSFVISLVKELKLKRLRRTKANQNAASVDPLQQSTLVHLCDTRRETRRTLGPTPHGLTLLTGPDQKVLSSLEGYIMK